MPDVHDHSQYVTKSDLKEALDSFERHLNVRQEQRIQVISGQYLELLESNKEVHRKLGDLVDSLQPILDAQRTIINIHSFFKWLGIPFGIVIATCYWIWKNI